MMCSAGWCYWSCTLHEIQVLCLNFLWYMTVKILLSGVFHSLSETAIELENNGIFKHTIQLSIFINLGHPHIRKKCLCMLAKNSFRSYLYFILHAHATYSWHNIVLFNNRNTWIVVSCLLSLVQMRTVKRPWWGRIWTNMWLSHVNGGWYTVHTVVFQSLNITKR